MAYAREFVRIRFLFSVANTDEIADTGLVLSKNDTESPGFDARLALGSLTTTKMDALFDTYVAMTLGANGFQWANYSKLIGIKASAHGTNGGYLNSPTERAFTSSNSGSAAQVEPQNTIVMTLWSGLSLGAGNFGRMYLPHTSGTLESTTPRLSASTAQTMATAMAAFVQNVKTIAGTLTGAPEPVIASKLGTGTNKRITQVRCGRVIDTQRRRRNALEEDYQVAPIT